MAHLVQRLLIVDDGEDDVFLLRHALRRARITSAVHWLEGGQAAIDYLKATLATPPDHPEVMFLDVKMPMVSGFDVLEWLQNHPEVVHPLVVVMLTSSSELKDQTRAAALGAHDFATKPPTAELFERLAKKYDLTWPRSN